jgi:AcrR family transcriptional regulator
MLSTRTQILEAARRLFGRQGYQFTSIREIAEQLGMTKTAVLYHFPTKADLLAAIAEPFVADLTAALEKAHTRQEVIEELLDVNLRHRELLRDNLMHDLALLAQEAIIRRYAQLMREAIEKVAGTNPDLAAKVRAAQAVAALSDPVIVFADEPVDALRAEVLRGIALLYPD